MLEKICLDYKYPPYLVCVWIFEPHVMNNTLNDFSYIFAKSALRATMDYKCVMNIFRHKISRLLPLLKRNRLLDGWPRGKS